MYLERSCQAIPRLLVLIQLIPSPLTSRDQTSNTSLFLSRRSSCSSGGKAWAADGQWLRLPASVPGSLPPSRPSAYTRKCLFPTHSPMYLIPPFSPATKPKAKEISFFSLFFLHLFHFDFPLCRICLLVECGFWKKETTKQNLQSDAVGRSHIAYMSYWCFVFCFFVFFKEHRSCNFFSHKIKWKQSGLKCLIVRLCVYVRALTCVCWESRGAKCSMYSTVSEHDDSIVFPLR